LKIIQEIKSLRDEASLPITTLSRIFKLSPYIIKQVLNSDIEGDYSALSDHQPRTQTHQTHQSNIHEFINQIATPMS
jgi:hypothetical protein